MQHSFDDLPALVERLDGMDDADRADVIWLAVQESETGHWKAKRGRVMIELHGVVACADSDEAAARAWYRDARISRRVTECGRAA
ncbi:hypothetical protein T8T21_05755 [Limimaricola variabilis]|uniref:hypothetical protein n=1 Tax=Limimaricola variabilis TaxID=1492771 RepID=UPI002AC94A8E|nr:hypothetical protein [Limimaricola variabilis]WPY95626.1 hypothetical protein T8T21_05755 [Limimaricola variabilis]